MMVMLGWWAAALVTWVVGCLWMLKRNKELTWFDMVGVGVLSVVPILLWMLLVQSLWRESCVPSEDSWLP